MQSFIKEKEHEIGTTGRILVRRSGTENLIRVMVEGKNQEKIEAAAAAIIARINSYQAAV
jgi:phosphoglucosamine mutase